jgi:hypothetical protein
VGRSIAGSCRQAQSENFDGEVLQAFLCWHAFISVHIVTTLRAPEHVWKQPSVSYDRDLMRRENTQGIATLRQVFVARWRLEQNTRAGSGLYRAEFSCIRNRDNQDHWRMSPRLPVVSTVHVMLTIRHQGVRSHAVQPSFSSSSEAFDYCTVQTPPLDIICHVARAHPSDWF